MKDCLVVDNTAFQQRKEIFHRVKYFKHFPKFFHYFTIWGLVSHAFLPDSHLFLMIKFQMALQIALGGFYITYIHPKYLYIPFWNIIIRHSPLYVMDFLSHYLPLIYYLFCTKIVYKSSLDFLVGYLPILCYFCLFDIQEMYHFEKRDIFNFVIIAPLVCTFMGLFFYSKGDGNQN